MPVKAAPAQALAAICERAFGSLSLGTMLKQRAGFILAGIPVYFMTQREELSSTLSAICTYGPCHPDLLRSELVSICGIAIAKDWFERLRARWAHTDGWETVATEGENRIELVDSARTARF